MNARAERIADELQRLVSVAKWKLLSDSRKNCTVEYDEMKIHVLVVGQHTTITRATTEGRVRLEATAVDPESAALLRVCVALARQWPSRD